MTNEKTKTKQSCSSSTNGEKPQEINKKETLTTLCTFINLHKQIIDKTNQKHNCPRKAKTKHNSKSKDKKTTNFHNIKPMHYFSASNHCH